MLLFVSTSRADRKRLETFVQITAIQAAPDLFLIPLENPSGLNIVGQLTITFLMLTFCHRDKLKNLGYRIKSLITSCLSKFRIHRTPLIQFTGSRGPKIVQGSADNTGRIGSINLNLAAFQKLEKSFSLINS